MAQLEADSQPNAVAAANHVQFPDVADETGSVIITLGDAKEYRREQLDRIRAESLGLEKQRRKLEQLIREYNARLEKLRAGSVEHRRQPGDEENAQRATQNPVQARARDVRDVLMHDNVDPPPFPRAS
jgi:hypothetical protein